MLNTYYPNVVLLGLVATEQLSRVRDKTDDQSTVRSRRMGFGDASVFIASLIVCLTPTFITKYIVYGSPFETGYVQARDWLWKSPQLTNVLFASNHGLITWTPIILFSIIGLIISCSKFPRVGVPLTLTFILFYLLICLYPNWDGISSFGNRFFWVTKL